jgi:hypothetical protein
VMTSAGEYVGWIAVDLEGRVRAITADHFLVSRSGPLGEPVLAAHVLSRGGSRHATMPAECQ